MADKQGQYRTILVFGAPGTGKGTQGKILGTIPGFFHLACGDVFRSLNPNSELGQIFLKYSSAGKLVPDNFTVRLWLDHIHRLVQTDQFHPDEEMLILDGIPRNRHQAEMMEEYIDVVLLVCLETGDEDQMVARIRRRALHENRLDDANEAVIRKRFEAYRAESMAVLEFYPPELIRTVDAGQTPMAVLKDVIESVQQTTAARVV